MHQVSPFSNGPVSSVMADCVPHDGYWGSTTSQSQKNQFGVAHRVCTVTLVAPHHSHLITNLRVATYERPAGMPHQLSPPIRPRRLIVPGFKAATGLAPEFLGGYLRSGLRSALVLQSASQHHCYGCQWCHWRCNRRGRFQNESE